MIIHDAMKLIKVRTWIPCSEQMPEDYENVFVFYPNVGEGENKRTLLTVDYAVDGKFVIEDKDGEDPYFGHPSHWMPLPKPPKGAK